MKCDRESTIRPLSADANAAELKLWTEIQHASEEKPISVRVGITDKLGHWGQRSFYNGRGKRSVISPILWLKLCKTLFATMLNLKSTFPKRKTWDFKIQPLWILIFVRFRADGCRENPSWWLQSTLICANSQWILMNAQYSAQSVLIFVAILTSSTGRPLWFTNFFWIFLWFHCPNDYKQHVFIGFSVSPRSHAPLRYFKY